MSLEQIKNYLNGLPLTNALWWFIENLNEDNEHRTAVFFYLRERMHNDHPKTEYKWGQVLAKQEDTHESQ